MNPMNDLISRQAAIDAMGRATWAINRINELPSAQPERKKGKWIERWHDNKHVIGDMACSVCGAQMLLTFPRFCPSCGADMRGEQE